MGGGEEKQGPPPAEMGLVPWVWLTALGQGAGRRADAASQQAVCRYVLWASSVSVFGFFKGDERTQYTIPKIREDNNARLPPFLSPRHTFPLWGDCYEVLVFLFSRMRDSVT